MYLKTQHITDIFKKNVDFCIHTFSNNMMYDND